MTEPTKNILIIGAGRRVRTTTLPVLAALERAFTIRGIFSRDAETLEVAGEERTARDIAALSAEDLAGVDLINVAVAKGSVPAVLERLARFDTAGLDLLIETPVLLLRHFCHVDRFARFRNVWVAEDCVELPCFDVLRCEEGAACFGAVKSVVFEHSAYKYHGLATVKSLFGGARILRARRTRTAAGGCRRLVTVAGGSTGVIEEPRDYARGRLVVVADRGSFSDRPATGESHAGLEPIVSGGRWNGFRVEDVAVHLPDVEVDLLGDGDPAASVTARMEDLKRVGLYRLLRNIHAGRGAYPLEQALEDMVVDYWVDRVGFYSANPLMDVGSGCGRFLLKKLTALAGGRVRM